MADFYGTSAGFKEFWTDRGDTVMSTQDDDVIEVALLIASEWIDGAFCSSFGGTKAGAREQVREWPRLDVFDKSGDSVPSESIPREIEWSTYLAAAENLRTPGLLYKNYTPPKYKSVSISGALSVQYASGAALDFQVQFPAINAMIAPLLTGHGATSALSGLIVRA